MFSSSNTLTNQTPQRNFLKNLWIKSQYGLERIGKILFLGSRGNVSWDTLCQLLSVASILRRPWVPGYSSTGWEHVGWKSSWADLSILTCSRHPCSPPWDVGEPGETQVTPCSIRERQCSARKENTFLLQSWYSRVFLHRRCCLRPWFCFDMFDTFDTSVKVYGINVLAL